MLGKDSGQAATDNDQENGGNEDYPVKFGGISDLFALHKVLFNVSHVKLTFSTLCAATMFILIRTKTRTLDFFVKISGNYFKTVHSTLKLNIAHQCYLSKKKKAVLKKSVLENNKCVWLLYLPWRIIQPDLKFVT
jgi:hypothetical protein